MVTVTHRNKEIELTLDKEAVFDYLIDLRDSGITNMLGAVPYIVEDLDCGFEEARYWLMTWIKSFENTPG
jgi:hypothetical protein